MTTSRAMILTILARYDGVDTTSGNTWYEAGAAWAVANGVSDGTSLEANLTREQLVTMLWRYAKYKGQDVSAAADLSAYQDGAQVSAYAAPAMQWACGTGVVQGSNGKLMPADTATRAEVAQILQNFVSEKA